MSQSGPEGFNPPTRTFEVSVDATSPEQLEALKTVVTQYGMACHETTVFPKGTDSQIDIQTKLINASNELFKTEVYGQGMATVLEQWRQNCSGALEVLPSGFLHWRFNRYSSYYNYPLKTHTGSPPANPKELETYARRELENTHLPCVLITSPTSGGGRNAATLAVNFGPGPITPDTLSSFVVARKFHKSQLRGSVGKALRVLSHVAGVRAGSQSLNVEADFIEFEELQDMISSRVRKASAELILQKINAALHTQLSTGCATKHGEVIIEGRFAAIDNSPTVTYERIARSSLAVIADHYTKRTVHSEFLRSLAE